jgi:hypothetical protein
MSSATIERAPWPTALPGFRLSLRVLFEELDEQFER